MCGPPILNWLRGQRKFSMTRSPSSDELLINCLSRAIGELDWMTPLRAHVSQAIPATWAAIGFDTNALKKLRRLQPATRAETLTYLQSKSVPIILPGQAVQEFWNNHGLFAKDVQNLEGETRRLAARYEKLGSGDGKVALERLVAVALEIADEVADSQNPRLLEESLELWELLMSEARIAQVPRSKYLELGKARLASGIAPGFADEKKRANGLGDFYVWADFLFGLLELRLSEASAVDTTIVFVTDDGKEDWLSSGVPHPTLLGETYHLTGRTLQVLSTDKLIKIAGGN